ncbi:Non-structural maintenance of chromosomes element 1 [Boothiomyces macroporosus]|uniref:Non-structural maintenance of chromosomes element 1 n=1 Tax=Boothiomyces macroporosus TaxID=261099 RepID=A0AAD5Y1P4_9FUNG|nr:Non-structural maintenance of chromosomes element 1 [Boothiomyces macroporosus]
MAEFGNANRLFLSQIISHKIISSEAAKQLYNKCKSFTNSSYESYVEFMKITNAGLELVDMKIRRGADPFSGDKFICLVNCKSDEIDSILTSDGTALDISSTEVLNSCSKLVPPISKQHGEEALNKLIAENWLISDKGRISLGLASILELDLYLKQQYADYVKTCVLCKEVILNKHDYCETNDCNSVAHIHCIVKNPTKKCPDCKSEWIADALPCSIEPVQINEIAEDSIEISQQETQSISAVQNDELGDELEESDEETTQKVSSMKRKGSDEDDTPKKKSSQQSRKGKRIIDSDDDE